MRRVAVAAAFVSLLLAARVAAAAGCIPGAQFECPCPGGPKSVQVCAPDGASLLPCQCAAVPPVAPAAPGPMTPAAFTVSPAVSASPGLMGSLDVSAPAPATISVDGGEVGRAPVHVPSLQPGVHVVAARFDAGGEARKKVRVSDAAATTIVMEPPMSAQAGAWRTGKHFGVSVGTEYCGLQEDFDGAGPAVAPEAVLNLGISPAVDIRVGGRLMLANAKNGIIVVFGAPVSARFNLGSVFSMGIGAFVGISSAYTKEWMTYDPPVNGVVAADVYPRETGLVGGLEAFPAIFRFGAKREIELGVGGGYLYHLTTENDVIHFGLNLTYLVL